MASEPSFRVGIVGTGWIARDHIVVLRKLGHRVVAVCDVDRARAIAAAPDGARVYEDWQELLDREELDAVWIATPPLHHRGPAVAAVARGLPVYLEKPIARTLADAAAIVEAVEQAGTVCAVGYQWHGTEALETLRRELAGQELALLLGRSIGPTASRPWFLDRESGGGNVLERGSHQIDLTRAVAGEVVRAQVVASGVVLAQGEGERGNIEDAATLLLHFESGALATIAVAWTREGLPGIYALDAVASEATLQLRLDPAFTLSGTSRGQRIKTPAGVHPFERTIARFLEAAAAGDPARVFCTPRDALGTLAVALACERSLLEDGRAVELSEILAAG